MVLLNLLLIAAVATTVGLSNRFFSPGELQDRFEKGQKLYALGNYEKAIPHFEAILLTQSNATIDVDEVMVAVDEYNLPVRVAATYQLGNTFNKLGLEKLKRSRFLRAEKNEAGAVVRYKEALLDLNSSLEYFARVILDEQIDQRTRVMALYQTVQTHYQLKEYKEAIREANRLITEFPNSIYETAAYYDIAWSHFELGEHEQAIEHFREVLTLSPSGSRSDRALLQIATSYEELGEYEEALDYLGRLIRRYDFSLMSEQEVIEMNTLKLKGIVKETARELVAKAQLKLGDIYGRRGQIDRALEVYAAVPLDYAAETLIVQDSYLRGAELVHDHRGTTAAVNAYKYAIEQVDDKKFQAKTQLQVSRLLFEEGQFEEAAREYDIYIKAYADVAARVGFTVDKAKFRLAQSNQAHGEQVRPVDSEVATAALDEALALYGRLRDELSDAELIPEVVFGIGYCHQLRGEREMAAAAFAELVDRHPDHNAAPNGLLQLARVHYEGDDYPTAAATYRRLLERYPETSLRNTAHMELGVTFRRMGDAEGTIAQFLAIEGEWAQWSKVQLELAELYAGQGEYSEAEEILRQTQGKIQEERLLARLHYIKGKAHFAQNEYEEAVTALGLSLAGGAEPGVVQSALLTRGASHYEIARQLDAAGDSTLARSRYESSMADLEKLLEADPPPHLKDIAYRTLGASMIRLQREEEAGQYYLEVIAVSKDPQERATFQMLLTELYYDMENFDQAEASARKLLSMEFADDNLAGYYRRERAYAIIGNVLLQQKQYGAAADIFAKGLERYPQSGESANLAFSKGLAQFSDAEYEPSVASFNDYLNGFPEHRNRVHGRYYLAHGLQAMTRFEQAAAGFEKLIERHPGSTYDEEAHFLVGENYYNERIFNLAEAAYAVLLQKYPEGKYNDVAQYALAWAFFEQEKMDEGVEAMKVLGARYSNSEFASKAQFTVGDYYYNLRAYDDAMEAYKKVISAYPKSDEYPKAVALVRELSEIQASLEYAQVMKLFDAGEYEGAAVGLKELAARYPGTYTQMAAYCNLGMAYENLRKWAQAVAYYDKALQQAGDDPAHYDVVTFSHEHRDWIVENRL